VFGFGTPHAMGHAKSNVYANLSNTLHGHFCSDTSVLCLIFCDRCCVAYRLVVVFLLRQYLLLLLGIQSLLHAEPLVSFVS